VRNALTGVLDETRPAREGHEREYAAAMDR
jgi:hypothetical protein